MVSPVTYSVASLIKRVFVIVVAILWFRSPTTKVQAAGIALTFFGLYLYDRTHDSARVAKRVHRPIDAPLLPLNTPGRSSSAILDTPIVANPRPGYSYVPDTIRSENKKMDANGPGRPRMGSRSEWLPPGTKQEDTWKPHDTST